MRHERRSPSFPRRVALATRKEEGRPKDMYGKTLYGLQDRDLREQDFARRVAERERYARSKRTHSLRARVARRLFALAVATEREETWRVVWERLEAKGRL